MKTATIINKTLAPYGIDEIIDRVEAETWQELATKTDAEIESMGGWGQVRAEYRDEHGAAVDITEHV